MFRQSDRRHVGHWWTEQEIADLLGQQVLVWPQHHDAGAQAQAEQGAPSRGSRGVVGPRRVCGHGKVSCVFCKDFTVIAGFVASPAAPERLSCATQSGQSDLVE